MNDAICRRAACNLCSVALLCRGYRCDVPKLEPGSPEGGLKSQLVSQPAGAIGGDGVDAQIDPPASHRRVIYGPDGQFEAGVFEVANDGGVDGPDCFEVQAVESVSFGSQLHGEGRP